MTFIDVISGRRGTMRVRQLPIIDFCVYIAEITHAIEHCGDAAAVSLMVTVLRFMAR